MKCSMRLARLCACVLTVGLGLPGYAADAAALGPPLDEGPIIDGNVTEVEWARAIRISNLHQVEPVEFARPSEKTEWYVARDETMLYIAARAYDSAPDRIAAQELRQGASINSDDSLNVLLDPFNNKRSGYRFALNPNGVRFDGIYTNGTRLASDWDGIWHGEARITDDGWSMEMAIPFSTLSFDPANDTWGVNFWREIARRDEIIGWRSRNGEVNPTVSGELWGFSGLRQGSGLDFIPSISSVYRRDRDESSTDTELEPSLDLRYRPGEWLNLLLTLNTDFAATDVDDRQLGLRRFSLFFPEKREFFLTDFDIFQFGGVPVDGDSREIGLFSGPNGLAFFSRRIGLSGGRRPVDIVGGVKASGRLGRYDFGTLYLRQDSYDDIGETDFIVGRISRSILAESTVGAIFTRGDPASNADNTLAGVDFLYRNTRLGANRTMVGQFWLQRSDNRGIDGDDTAWSAVVSFPARRGFEFGAQYQHVEANFRPPVGFANRVGVRLTGAEAAHTHVRADALLLREVEQSISFERWEFLDTGRLQSQNLEVEYLTLRSVAGDRLRFRFSARSEGLLPGEQPLEDIGVLIPPGEYDFERHSISIRSARHRPISARLDVSNGGFFNGDRFEVSPEIEWIPNRHLKFSVEYSYNRYSFPGIVAITRELALGNTIAFNSKYSLISLLQYDNVSEDVGVNVRFRFNQRAGRDIWLVLNHNWVDDPAEDRWRSTQTNAAAKIRFTYRY